MTTQPVLAVVGENIIDLIPTGSGTYEAIAGGSPANIAVAASRLGTPTGLIARVSRDAYGEQITKRLEADGVLGTFLVEADEPSSVARVSFDAERRASYDFDMTGTLGRISMPVREGGTGELIYSQQGTRRSCGARSEDGSAIDRGTEVVVMRYDKGIAYVRRWDEIHQQQLN